MTPTRAVNVHRPDVAPRVCASLRGSAARLQNQPRGRRGACRRSAAARGRRDATEAATGLQEIVVTARKRTENLQDVPLSIDVFTKKDMQNLGITSFDDFAEKVPSISFISVGPGTQLFVMRGVSDGSNPNYSNTSATGFFVDDMSMSWHGRPAGPAPVRHRAHRSPERPAGHDLRREFHGGRHPLHHQQAGRERLQRGHRLRRRHISRAARTTGPTRASSMPRSSTGCWDCGFPPSATLMAASSTIELTTRTWVNTAVSDNSAVGAQRLQPRACRRRPGGPEGSAQRGLERVPHLQLSAPAHHRRLGRRSEPGAADRRALRPGGPSVRSQDARSPRRRRRRHRRSRVREHLLVTAHAGSRTSTRSTSRISVAAPTRASPAPNDPVYGTGPYTGCKVPIQYYEYHTNPQRWSNELRLSSKAGGRFHWLGGLYWEKTIDKNSGSTFYMPGLRTNSPAFHYYNYYYGTPPGSTSLPPTEWYAYTDAHRLPADHRIRQYQLRHHQTSSTWKRGSCTFIPIPATSAPTGSSPTRRRLRHCR